MAEYEQRFLYRDNQRLAYHRYPVDSEVAIVLLPAMGVPAGYYRRFALTLNTAGHDVTVADLRGTGASTPRATRATRYGYPELVDDAEILLSELAPTLTGRKTLLIGHSLGGQLSSLLLARQAHRGLPTTVDGLCLIACGLPYHALYGWRSPILFGAATMMHTASAVRGHWPGYGFAGRQAHGVIRDWAHTVRRGRFVPISGTDLDADLAEVKLPLLAVSVDGDRFTPPRVVRHLTDKLRATDLTEFHYTHAAAGTRLDHFRWARHHDGIIPRLTDFIAGL